MRNWRASLAEERAYFETGDLPNPRMNMTDIMGAVEAAGVKVALAPARTLEQMTLKAEVAEYFLGGIKVVEDALAKEQRGNDCMQNMMALGLLRDLLRLLPSEGRPEH